MKLHLFDVDFTIVGCSTVRAFVSRGLREGLIGPSIGFYAPLLIARYALAGAPGDPDGRAYPFLRGVPRAKLEALAQGLFDEVFARKINPLVAARIASVREAGERLAIASSSFVTILRPIALHLGIGDIVANELEYSDGLATGRLAGRPVFGDGKRSRVMDFLKEVGAEPGDCAFYSDSRRDLPLLRGVGEPIAVNPDRGLRKTARECGWEIIAANGGEGGKDHA